MTLENLTRYEGAAVAGINAKKEPGIALAAISEFYTQITGLENDPIFGRAFANASVGVQNDTGISDGGVLEAIGTYSHKYEEAFKETTLEELTGYLTNGLNLSENVTNGLSTYNDSTITQLIEKANEDNASNETKQSIQKTITSLEMLKELRLKTQGTGLYTNNLVRQIESIYAPEQE